MRKNKLLSFFTIGLLMIMILIPSNVSFAKGRFHNITVKVFAGESTVENARIYYVKEGTKKDADVKYDSEKKEYYFTAEGGGGYMIKVEHDLEGFKNGQSAPFKLNGESEDPTIEIHLVANGTLRLSGHVRDKNGNPLKDAVVLLEAFAVKTDENGYYEIKGISGGNYTIGAFLSKYAMAEGQPGKINLTESKEDVDFVLEPKEEEIPESKFQISGIITFNGVLAAQNSVKVTLTKGEQNYEAFVNENGCYKFTPNGGGTYLIKVFKNDKEIGSRTTELKGQSSDGKEKVMVLEDFHFLVPLVEANPAGGLYNKPQSIELSINNDVPGLIKYSFDGENWLNYSEPVTIDTEGKRVSRTLWYYAISSDNQNLESEVKHQDYIIDEEAPTAWADAKGGLYNTDKKVTLGMSEEGTIYYTVDGLAPTNESAVYQGPIDISKTSTLKYIAVDKAGNQSKVYSEEYTIDKETPTAWADAKGGLYNTDKKVTLGMSEEGTIYYTVDGLAPTNESAVYQGPIDIIKTSTLKYIAVDKAGNISQVYEENYTIEAKSSESLPNTGSYGGLLAPFAMILIAAGGFMVYREKAR